MMQLMTIGYEGCTLDPFLQVLTDHKIQTLVDVREFPISRKAGFSKTALSQACLQRNIYYIHLRSLGCPKPIRHDYRADKDWQRFTRRYLTYLATQETPLHDLAKRTQQERCCLLCFEADYRFCHRQFVAEKVIDVIPATATKTVMHLKGQNPTSSAQQKVLEGKSSQ
jgi:uncharacterized protein (DUF488 family)